MAKTRQWAAFLCVAAAAGAALHVCASLGTPVGAAGDDALHLLLARNLLHGGFALPDASGTPATAPLPGFAMLMALPVLLLSPHWALLRGAALAATFLLAFLAFRLCRRLSGAAAGWAAVLLVLANPVLAAWAGGAVLAAALAAAAGFRGGGKRAATVLSGALAPLALWLLRGHLLTGSATSYI